MSEVSELMKKNKAAIILGVFCLVLTYAIAIQFKTIEESSKLVANSRTESDLRDEVLKWKERYDNVYAQVEISEKKLEKVRQEITANDDISAAKREQIKQANYLLGLTGVTGKGVVLTLDDNKTQITEGLVLGNVSDYIIHDNDLIRLINEIKNAGVEAIAINDQRIVSTTGIVCDGSVVRVNGQKISSPFEIKIIGYPETIMGSLTFPTGYLETLRTAGLVKEEPKKVNSITIPKYTGIISIKYLNAVETEVK